MAYIVSGREVPVPPQRVSAPPRSSSLPHRSFIELRGSIVDVGILRDTLLPSLALHSGLSLVAWSVGRANDDYEAQDWLWPSSHLVNAWWASIGRRVAFGKLSPIQALRSLSRPEYLLLGGVTVWATRKLYVLSSRRQARRKNPVPKAVVADKDQYWNDALSEVFLPTAVIQTIITLPFTAPFYHQGGVFTGYHPWIQALSIAVFGTGLALQTFADYQLDEYNKSPTKDAQVNREGIFSLVRHPSSLGDFLVHLSFPVLLFSSDMLAPIELLGPFANYVYLHYTTASPMAEYNSAQNYSKEKKSAFEDYRDEPHINSLWPAYQQFANPWLWSCVGLGVAFAAVEQVFHQLGLD